MFLNILITGHKGYIGSTLTQFLTTAFTCNIIGYDHADGNDIMDYNNLLISMKNIDIVIHLAALSTVSACNDDPTYANIVNGIGTQNVLKAMTECGCNRIIYASTSSIYGSNKVLPYTEDMVPSPCSAYGVSKLLGEQAINEYDGNYLIYRMFNICGEKEGMNVATNVGHDRLFGALKSGRVNVYGKDFETADGTCERDYVSLTDTCRAYVLGVEALCANETMRETINICSGQLSSVDYIIKTWNNISNMDDFSLPKVTSIYGDRRLGDPPKVYGCNELANKIIKWQPKMSVIDIIIELAIKRTSI